MKKIVLILAVLAANLMADNVASLAVLADSKNINSNFDFESAKRIDCDDKRILTNIKKYVSDAILASTTAAGVGDMKDLVSIDIKMDNEKTLNENLGICRANFELIMQINLDTIGQKFGKKLDDKDKKMIMDMFAKQVQNGIDSVERNVSVKIDGNKVSMLQMLHYSGFVDKNSEVLILTGEKNF